MRKLTIQIFGNLIDHGRYTSLSDSETTCDPPARLRVFPDLLTRSVSRSDAGGANRQWYVKLTVRHVTLDFCDPKSAGLYRSTRPSRANFADNKKESDRYRGILGQRI
jgi:hypothetical protein